MKPLEDILFPAACVVLVLLLGFAALRFASFERPRVESAAVQSSR
jgi:hypothetical protein